MTPSVPLFAPDIGLDEETHVLEVLRSGWIVMGPRVEEFEQRFADSLRIQHAVAVNSGTAALHLANVLLDITRGDEVIVPSLTFAATAHAAYFTGAKPVFADVIGPDDWTLDPHDVARRITKRTRAVIAMHYGGYPCDMTALSRVCEEAGLRLIEDACHGLGGYVNGQPMGSLGAIGCFSFYSNKVMTTAEGGMVVTNDGKLAERARRLRSHGMTATAVDRTRGAFGYEITEVGFNYRMDDLRAALGLAQLKRLDEAIRRRRRLVQAYRERLEGIPRLKLPEHGRRGEPAHYILPVLVDGIDRNLVRARLAEFGVQTSVHYQPVHLFPHFFERKNRLPHTEWIAERSITLPLYPSLSESQVDYICHTLRKILS